MDNLNRDFPDDSSQPPKTVAQSNIDRKRGRSSRLDLIGYRAPERQDRPDGRPGVASRPRGGRSRFRRSQDFLIDPCLEIRRLKFYQHGRRSRGYGHSNRGHYRRIDLYRLWCGRIVTIPRTRKGWDMKYQHPQDLPGFEASARERLERLAQFAETIAPEILTFTKWYGHGKGCAVGLAAATDPWFQAQGLGLRHNENLKECQPIYRDSSSTVGPRFRPFEALKPAGFCGFDSGAKNVWC